MAYSILSETVALLPALISAGKWPCLLCGAAGINLHGGRGGVRRADVEHLHQEAFAFIWPGPSESR